MQADRASELSQDAAKCDRLHSRTDGYENIADFGQARHDEDRFTPD